MFQIHAEHRRLLDQSAALEGVIRSLRGSLDESETADERDALAGSIARYEQDLEDVQYLIECYDLRIRASGV